MPNSRIYAHTVVRLIPNARAIFNWLCIMQWVLTYCSLYSLSFFSVLPIY